MKELISEKLGKMAFSVGCGYIVGKSISSIIMTTYNAGKHWSNINKETNENNESE